MRRNNRITHDCNVIALHREVRIQRRLLEVRRAHDLRAVTVQHCIQRFAVHQLLIREIIFHANAAGQHRRRIRRRVIDHCHLRDAVAMVRFQKELEERLAAGEELTELTVDEILHKYRSAQDKFIVESFGTIAAYGGNAAMMHYHATEEDHAKLERKGFLLVDSGATYLDGTTDITRTYPLGELTEDEKLFYTWTLQCHIDIAKAVWLNYCDGHMLDTIAREPLWQHLINYRCGTGHSVSFVGNVHEGPHALNGRNTTLMRPGMIVTDEPGVYEAGEVGIRIENEIECYHKADNQYGTFLAFRPLTFVPIATSPIVPGVLDKEQVAWLNDYHRKVFEQLAPRLTEDERAWLAEKCAAIGC